MSCRFTRFDQAPIISRKQAEHDAMEKGLEGLVIGLAAGLLIGTTIAMLVAPKSGKQTRQDIKDASYFSACGVKDKTVAVGTKIKENTQCFSDKLKGKFSSKTTSCCCEDEVEENCCCEGEPEETCCCEGEGEAKEKDQA